MISLPESGAQCALQSATAEAAASLHSDVRGIRPQWAALPLGPSLGHTLRAPSLNVRLACLIANRQAQLAARGQRVIVAEPHRLAFRSLLGVRRVGHELDLHGYALNMEFTYRSPSGKVYILSGVAKGFADGPLTGQGWARECSCPDFQKRRGPARDSLRGEERCCKHMRLFLAVMHLWQGQLPWIGGIPKEQLLPGEAWVLRVF